MTKKIFLILITLLLIFSIGCGKEDIVEGEEPNDVITTGSAVEEDEKDEDQEEEELTEEEKAQIEYDKYIEDLENKEAGRKNNLGEFYIELPKLTFEEFLNKDQLKNEKVKAKGLYLTGDTAAMGIDEEDVETYAKYVKALEENNQGVINELISKIDNINRFERAIAIAQVTEVNAFVIDVKDDSGLMTYRSNFDLVEDVNANRRVRIKDIKALTETLKEYNIYTIARIVAFKDPNFAHSKLDHAIQLKSGGVWTDYSGTSWVNPFDKYVWDYNVAIAKEAAINGFDEIQFDYVRFPDNARVYNEVAHFPGREGREKDEAIGDFLEYSESELVEYNVHLAADVFGLITRNWDDEPEDIGQTWIEIAPFVEYVCPMSYPSHYGPGWYGYSVPDAHPYGVLRGSMIEAIEKNAAVKNDAIIRPWIQGFTAGWVEGHIFYSPDKIRDQIVASKELGVDEYLIWDAGNTYDPKIFFLREEEKTSSYPLETGDMDLVERSPSEAVTAYLKGEYNNMLSRVYLLTPVDDRVHNFKEFYNEFTNQDYELMDYEVFDYEMTEENKAKVSIYYKYKIKSSEEEYIEVENATWNTIKEKGVWKVERNIKSN